MSHLREQLYAKLHNYIVAFDLRTAIITFLLTVTVMIGLLWIIQRTHQRSGLLWALCFSVWLTVALVITLLARMPIAENTQNTVFSSFSELHNGHCGIWYDMLFNVLLFVPCGWMLCMKTNSFLAILSALVLSCSIEIAQLLTNHGLLEIMDKLSNTIGGAIGTLFYLIFVSIRRKKCGEKGHAFTDS